MSFYLIYFFSINWFNFLNIDWFFSLYVSIQGFLNSSAEFHANGQNVFSRI